MFKKTLLAAATSLIMATSVQAAVFEIEAKAHSMNSGSGTGLDTGLFYNAGQMISGFVNPNDLWSAGALPRWSNADGLTDNLYATGTDESGQTSGKLIGKDFGLKKINGFSAPYGSLVGEISGSYYMLGTSFNVEATETGTLTLFYWDTYTGDNTNSVLANITAPVPEPSTYAMMIGGLGLVGLMAIRRKKQA